MKCIFRAIGWFPVNFAFQTSEFLFLMTSFVFTNKHWHLHFWLIYSCIHLLLALISFVCCPCGKFIFTYSKQLWCRIHVLDKVFLSSKIWKWIKTFTRNHLLMWYQYISISLKITDLCQKILTHFDLKALFIVTELISKQVTFLFLIILITI